MAAVQEMSFIHLRDFQGKAEAGIKGGFYQENPYNPLSISNGKTRIVSSEADRRTGDIVSNRLFESSFVYIDPMQYAMAAFQAVDSQSYDGAVIDMGCADGILSRIAVKNGASGAIGIDLEAGVLGRFRADIHSFDDPERYQLLQGDIRNQEIYRKIDRESVTCMIANIGPHYPGSPDIAALKAIPLFPNLERVIIGGFVNPMKSSTTRYHPSEAMCLLKEQCFFPKAYWTAESTTECPPFFNKHHVHGIAVVLER